MSRSERLSLPYLQPAQAQKHVTHNEALQQLDVLVQLAVEGIDASIPPALPAAGEVHALGAGPTGAWAGHAGELAAWIDGTWQFIAPQEGWQALDKVSGRLYRHAGGSWQDLALPDLTDLPGVGVNASHDSTNRLSVSAPATLLNHEGAGHQLKLNKATEADTASLLFQTGWSGRAEMGTAGEEDFTVKVSADGSNWATGLRLDAATGGLQLPTGQNYYEDVFILDNGVWSTDIPWSDPARILLWMGVNVTGYYFLVSVTGGLSGAGNFGAMFANPAGRLDFATGVLTGTTGTDGNITLSIDASGAVPRLYLENRLGSNRLFTLATLGK